MTGEQLKQAILEWNANDGYEPSRVGVEHLNLGVNPPWDITRKVFLEVTEAGATLTVKGWRKDGPGFDESKTKTFRFQLVED